MSEGMNPNVATTDTPEKLSIAGGDSPVSFDEIDSLHSSSVVYDKESSDVIGKSEKKGESKNESKKSSKESSEEKSEEVSKSKKEESESEPDTTEKDSSKDKDKEKDNKEKKEEPVKEDKKSKSYRVKSGEDFLELKSDTHIPVTINGRKESATLQELINEFSGKKDLDRRYSEFDKKFKDFEKKSGVTDGVWKEFHKLSTVDKNPIAAIQMLGELTGENMISFWKDFRQNMEPIFERRFQMTPEERRVLDLEEEIKLRDSLEQRRTHKATSEKQRQEYVAKIESMREEAGLSQDEFVKIYKELESSGVVDKKQLTPEVVVNYHKELSARKALAQTITEINPSIDDTELNEAVSVIREHWISNPGLTLEDVKLAAIEAYGDKRSKALSRKIAKSEPTKNYKTERSRDGSAISFDDI